jgi:chromosome segregation protein
VNSAGASRKVLEERRVALAGTLERIRSQRSDTESRLRMIRLREEQSHERLNDLGQEIEVLRGRSETLVEQSRQAEDSLKEVQERFISCKQGLQEVEEQLQELREQKEISQNRRSEVEVEHARFETLLQNLEAQCIEHLRVPIAEAVQGVDFESAKRDEILEQYHTLKANLDNFGPINMTALTEYQEHQERFDFLTKQREDLEKSIADTTKAIQEINRRSRVLFSEAFEAVNLNFKEVFQKLFGGGDCGMRLLDEDDVLECGIDLYAQPPGKRLQNVMLLSGGEKALTVFALLIGIFMFRPSQFCVLDEVDAPLDDANVRRFGSLIEEMSNETQFIIVTHNKRTMEMARALHGVTMEEPGVSKVISAQI